MRLVTYAMGAGRAESEFLSTFLNGKEKIRSKMKIDYHFADEIRNTS